MQVKIINTSNSILYIDLDGKANTSDTIIVGAKGNVVVGLSEERHKALSTELKGKATLRIIK